MTDRGVPEWRWWSETAIIATLGAAAVIGPLALGGTPTSIRCGLDLVLAFTTVAWICIAPRSAWLSCVPVMAAGLVALQLMPLPLPVLAWLAPASARAWGGIGPIVRATISIDPGLTAEGLRHVLLGLSATVVVADLCRDAWRRWVLVGAFTTSAILIWGLAIAFPMNSQRLVLGRYSINAPDIRHATSVLPPVRTAAFSTESGYATAGRQRYFVQRWGVGDGIGCYVVSNSFAAGMYLTIPMMLTLWRVRCRGSIWAPLAATVTILAFAAAVWTVGVQAGSRAGAGAMALAGIVFMLVSSEHTWARRTWTIITVLAACALVGFTLVFFHLATWPADALPADLRDHLLAALSSEGRNVFSRVALRLFAGSPVLGTGLGTFGFTQVLHVAPQNIWYFTHNDYAQLLAETGIVGGVSLVAMLAVLSAALVRTWHLSGPERMIAAGAWSALAGIGLHSLFDWNMHLPANSLLACLAVGLALAVGAAKPERHHTRWRVIPAIVLAGACLVTACLSVRDCQAEWSRMSLRLALMNARNATTADQADGAITQLKRGVALARALGPLHRTDSELPMLAGQALLHLDAAGETIPGESADEWFATARRRNPLRLGTPHTVPSP